MRIRIFAGALILLISGIAQAHAEPTKFHKWTVACGTDRVSDTKQCSMDQNVDVAATPKDAIIFFNIYRGIKGDKPQIMVFSTSLQRSEPVYIRVDKNPARASKNYVKGRDAVTFPDSESIIAEMQKGKSAFVRFTDRYSNIAYDADIDLQGFTEALDYLNSIKE